MKNNSMVNFVSESTASVYSTAEININTQAAVLGVDPYHFLDSVEKPSLKRPRNLYMASAVLQPYSKDVTAILPA